MLPESVWIEKKTDSSVYNLCIKAGNVLHVRHITLFNMWWMCLPLTEIAWGLFTLLLPRSSINRSYLLWKYTHAVFDGSGLWLLVCLGLFSLLKKMEDSRYHEASKSKMSLFQVKNNHRLKAKIWFCFPMKLKIPWSNFFHIATSVFENGVSWQL